MRIYNHYMIYDLKETFLRAQSIVFSTFSLCQYIIVIYQNVYIYIYIMRI
jgi:hypothetical protein